MQCNLLFGKGPAKITNQMAKTFLKYNSGSKTFTEIPIKEFSVTTDAIVLLPLYTTSKKN